MFGDTLTSHALVFSVGLVVGIFVMEIARRQQWSRLQLTLRENTIAKYRAAVISWIKIGLDLENGRPEALHEARKWLGLSEDASQETIYLKLSAAHRETGEMHRASRS